MGSAALDMAYVACGRFDAYIERGISLWDIAAGWLLVESAGGMVDLRPRKDLKDKYSIVASNGVIDLNSEPMIRNGIGYDMHRLVEGRSLILGGVEIPHSRGLEGHSDADVLLHAIADALLGAAWRRRHRATFSEYRRIDSRYQQPRNSSTAWRQLLARNKAQRN